MYVETFPVGAFQCNCSIVADEEKQEAILIDPGAEAPKIIQKLKEKNFTLKYILHTHAHLDHVMGTAEVHQACRGELCLHQDDLELYENVPMQCALFNMPPPLQEVLKIDHFVEDGDHFKCGALNINIYHTPGHSPGSVCFHVQNSNQEILFTGDTLFAGSIGRSDLWGGNHQQLLHSIKKKLLCLDPEIPIISGHGPQSKIGFEKRSNPFLNGIF